MQTATLPPIPQANAWKAYQEADDSGKKLLENLIGKDNLTPPDIKTRVKTYEDALQVLGISDGISGDLALLDNGSNDVPALIAHHKLSVIARALNEGWAPDWSNSSQWKYYPWFKWNAGSGFAFDDFVCANAVSYVGSRLCFKSEELAKYAGQQFTDLYNQLFTL